MRLEILKIFRGETTYFSGEMWCFFVSSPLTLGVKLQKKSLPTTSVKKM